MKTKVLISFVVTANLIYAFVFAYADCWFSHEAAHIMMGMLYIDHMLVKMVLTNFLKKNGGIREILKATRQNFLQLMEYFHWLISLDFGMTL